LSKGGEFAQGLEKGRAAALVLHEKLKSDDRLVAGFVPELDIVVFVPRGDSAREISAMSRAIFTAAAKRGLHLAVAELPVTFFDGLASRAGRDRQTVSCLRSVLMKPEHLDWIDRIWDIFQGAADECFSATPTGSRKSAS
jgi:tyrosine decarboxylase / aspartate 1-decarboxylase